MSTFRSLAAALLIPAVAACATAPAPAALMVGRDAPETSFALADGRELRLEAARGHVVVLAFFTTYCPTSRAFLQAVDELGARNSASGLDVIAVYEGDTASAAGAFANRHGLRVPLAFDKNGAAAERMGLVTVPSVVVIDRRGSIRLVRSGYRGQDDFVEVVREVSRLLAPDSRPALDSSSLSER